MRLVISQDTNVSTSSDKLVILYLFGNVFLLLANIEPVANITGVIFANLFFLISGLIAETGLTVFS